MALLLFRPGGDYTGNGDFLQVNYCNFQKKRRWNFGQIPEVHTPEQSCRHSV
jgi:hypothetical protein